MPCTMLRPSGLLKPLLLSLLVLVVAARGYSQQGWQWVNPIPFGSPISSIVLTDSNTIVGVSDLGSTIKSTDRGLTWKVDSWWTKVNLHSVWFTDKDRGIAVGNSSSNIYTTDGGETWFERPPAGPTNVTLNGVCFATPLVGVAVGGTAIGEPGTVLRTTDGGVSWTKLWVAAEWLDAVTFVNANVGYAVGCGGSVIRTTDGGAQWTVMTATPSSELNSVAALDESRLVAAGNFGGLFSSTDAGATWNDHSVGGTASFYAVSAAGSNTYVAIGANNLFYQSTDGGMFWTKLNFTGGRSMSWRGTVGVIGGGAGEVVLSTDGGSSWTPKGSRAATFPLSDVAFSSPTNAVAVGNGPAVLRSTDGGLTWEPHQLPLNPGSMAAVTFRTPTAGYAVGGDYYNPYFLRTSDGGSTWSASPTGYQSAWSDVCFVDDSTGIAVGSSLFRTTNGGVAWSQKGSTAYSFYDLQMINERKGVAAAGGTFPDAGVIFTTDGGTTWSEFKHKLGISSAVSFVNERFGGLAGMGKNGGAVALTTDGGSTWSLKEGTDWANILSTISFFDSLRGIVAGDNKITRTTDGGSTWSTVEIPGSDYVHCVKMLDADLAIAGKGWGDILRTTDGGSTWTNVFSGQSGDSFESFSFPTQDIGFAFGFRNGDVARTTDRGATWSLIAKGAFYWDDANRGCFPTPNRGFLALGTGLAQSTDGGYTWQKMEGAGITGGEAISFADSLHGVIGGYGGAAFRTTDGGNTWINARTDLLSNFSGVSFASHDLGYAAGRSVIARTKDAGMSWSPTVVEGGAFGDIVALDATTAIAAGSNGVVVKTTDGGDHWTQVNTGGLGGSKLCFSDPLQGTLFGSGGSLLRTTDAGSSWTQLRNIPTNRVSSAAFATPDIGIAVGWSGSILRTANGGLTGIEESRLTEPAVPRAIALLPNYPNPFNPTTNIRYQIPDIRYLRLVVYDLLGREVAVLVDGEVTPGEHQVTWNAGRCASGVYICRLQAGPVRLSQKLLLLR
jgi:photosystem II stability/assembly factor-like uncharacterized protein